VKRISQIWTVLILNLSGLPKRAGASLVAIVGVAGVAAVLISVMAIGAGFEHVVADAGRQDRAIVMRAGATTELSSSLTQDAVTAILRAPGIRAGSGGAPVASAESLVVVNLPQKNAQGAFANVGLRGVQRNLRELRPEIRITQGRMFRPGLREIVAGRAATAQFANLAVGDHVHLYGGDWTVSGVFSSNGDIHESEVMGDAETVMSTFHRPTFQSMTVLLDSPARFGAFREALTNDPSLTVGVERESAYFRRSAATFSRSVKLIADIVGAVMAVGALFGALNTMYSSIATRTVEIATLRAMGFYPVSILASIVLESVFLCLVGGAAGILLSYAILNGVSLTTLDVSSATQVVFGIRITPDLMAKGVLWACIIGVIGGLIPAVSAARRPISRALLAVT
jgi:putative ABC transport system permease protein